MAMKMINKKDCEYKGGYIINNGEIVCIDNEVVDLLNKLEEDVQRAQFEATKKSFCVSLSNDEFVRKTERGNIIPYVEAKTPELDKMAEQTVKIMDEIDSIGNAAMVNEYFQGIKPLILFTNDEFIVSCEHDVQHAFDLPTIGNPLELTKEDLSEWVLGLFE